MIKKKFLNRGTKVSDEYISVVVSGYKDLISLTSLYMDFSKFYLFFKILLEKRKLININVSVGKVDLHF